MTSKIEWTRNEDGTRGKTWEVVKGCSPASPGCAMADVAEVLVSEGTVTVAEATRITSIGKSSLYGAMERGELAYCKIGKARRIPRRALTQWLARHLVSRNDDSAEGTHGTDTPRTR